MTRTVCAAHRRAWHPLTANRWTNRGWLRCAARLARSLARDDNVCIYVRKPRERTAGSIFRRPLVEGTRRGRGRGREWEGKSYTSPIRESRSPSFSFSPTLSFVIRTHIHICLVPQSRHGFVERSDPLRGFRSLFWPTSLAELIETHTHTRAYMHIH